MDCGASSGPLLSHLTPTQQLSYFLIFERSLSLLLSLSPVPALSLALSYPLNAGQAPYLFQAGGQHSFPVGMQGTTSRSGEGAQWMGSPGQGQPREGNCGPMRFYGAEVLQERSPVGGRRGPWQAPATPSWPQLPPPLAAGTAQTSGQPEAQIVQG